MEEMKQKLDTIDINSIAQTNMSLENPQLLVEEDQGIEILIEHLC